MKSETVKVKTAFGELIIDIHENQILSTVFVAFRDERQLTCDIVDVIADNREKTITVAVFDKRVGDNEVHGNIWKVGEDI